MCIRALVSRRWSALLAVVCCIAPSSPIGAEESSAYRAALHSIASEELMHHLGHLAGDRFEGREAGKTGGRAAGNYLAERCRRLGLRPAGDEESYFQCFGDDYRNVLALLEGSDPHLKKQVVLIGAHYDHVGRGNKYNSRGPVGQIHNGADDNASGTSGLLELAEAFSSLPQPPKRSILFVFWDAEELGMLGSNHWIESPTIRLHRVVATLNLDMIGRLRDNQLTVLGSRSGIGMRRLVSMENDDPNLQIDFSWSMYPNADHFGFFKSDIPVLMFHTGEHGDYHSPRDDTELINDAGTQQVARLVFKVAYELAECRDIPRMRREAEHENEQIRDELASRLSTPPDRLGAIWARPLPANRATSTSYVGNAAGVRIDRIVYNSPAQRSGLRRGDQIVEFAGYEIQTDEDLNRAVFHAESPASVVVRPRGRVEPREVVVRLNGKPARLGVAWRVDAAEPRSVILTRVTPGSPAARAGLTPGDRIYRIGGRDFSDDKQFAEFAKTLPGPLPLLVERRGRVRTTVLYLDEEVEDPDA